MQTCFFFAFIYRVCKPPGVGQVCTRYPPPPPPLDQTRINNVNKAWRGACNNTRFHLNAHRWERSFFVKKNKHRNLRPCFPADPPCQSSSEIFPLWNGVMRVTVDPTFRFPAGTNLAHMVRRASPFWIFCHVCFNIPNPLSFPPSHIRSLSLPLAVSHSLARSAAHVTPPWARERERNQNRAGLQLYCCVT